LCRFESVRIGTRLYVDKTTLIQKAKTIKKISYSPPNEGIRDFYYEKILIVVIMIGIAKTSTKNAPTIGTTR
jgi:hypothetical protein